MTPEIELAFSNIKDRYGSESISRVESMLDPANQNRHPLQKEARWVLPGLTSKPWHDPYEHPELAPFVRKLEVLHPRIKAEVLRAVEAGTGVDRYDHYKVSDDRWQAIYLFRGGAPVEASRELVPTTFRFMEEDLGDWLCPLLEMHFSMLSPHTRIPPHCDLWNFTINLHLAVSIPEDCGIRVANETRQWDEGKCLLFDYSYRHQAWNDSDRHRICLLMDLWNPEVTAPEREALVALITEIRKLMG
ncbi:MAG: aspartyl/asparaginyl beta-hydroxylase domain-containing protein [Acidobacteriota bacterium]